MSSVDPNPLPKAPMASPAELMAQAQAIILLNKEMVAAQDAFSAAVKALSDSAAKRFESARDMSGAAKQTAIRNEVAQLSGSARDEFVAKAADIVRRLGKAKADLDLQRPYYGSRVSILMRSGLGSAERANFEATFAMAGKAQLTDAAIAAVGTRNPVMAAAAAQVNDSKPAQDRGNFSAAALAERIKLPAWERSQAAFGIASANIGAALQVYRVAQQTRHPTELAGVSSAAKIAAGLSARTGAGLGAYVDQRTGNIAAEFLPKGYVVGTAPTIASGRRYVPVMPGSAVMKLADA